MDGKTGILIYEKDANLGNLLQEYLQLQGYQVVLSADRTEVVHLCLEKGCTLCVLDIVPDDPAEQEICKTIKTKNADIAVIFMASKPHTADVIAMFLSGADDLVRKPFILEELLARMRAILWRAKGEKPKSVVYYRLGKYLFDTRKQTLMIEDTVLQLTTKESALLALFCEHANKVVERMFALRSVWKSDSYFSARSMDVYITKLRKLLKQDPDLSIVNIHGHGYKLVTSKAEI